MYRLKTPALEWTRRRVNALSNRLSAPKQTGWAWALPSADRSSRATKAGSGSQRLPEKVRFFSSRSSPGPPPHKIGGQYATYRQRFLRLSAHRIGSADHMLDSFANTANYYLPCGAFRQRVFYFSFNKASGRIVQASCCASGAATGSDATLIQRSRVPQ